jgi:hypothetical protein
MTRNFGNSNYSYTKMIKQLKYKEWKKNISKSKCVSRRTTTLLALPPGKLMGPDTFGNRVWKGLWFGKRFKDIYKMKSFKTPKEKDFVKKIIVFAPYFMKYYRDLKKIKIKIWKKIEPVLDRN